MATEHDDLGDERHEPTAGEQGRPSQEQFEESGYEERDIPSIRKRSATNKAITIFGFIVMAILALMLLYLVNRPKKLVEPEAERTVQNTMPNFSVPNLDDDVEAQSDEDLDDDGEAEEDEDLIWQRKISGSIMASGGSGSSGANAGQSREDATARRGGSNAANDYLDAMARLNAGAGEADETAVASKGRLAGELEPTVTDAVKAGILPDRNYVIAKGTALDCVLETAIDSSVPGMTTCTLTRDIYSDNGKVLLLDKGTQLVGEYRGDLKQGQARMFLLWTRAKTPNGVVVDLDSPATDELGRSGADGYVESFFWKRFGAAILMSIVSDGLDAATRNRNGDNINFGGTARAGERVVESILRQHENIPPRLTRNQGTRLQVMVARDLDFSDVYALRKR